jgi:hypothetical protein
MTLGEPFLADRAVRPREPCRSPALHFEGAQSHSECQLHGESLQRQSPFRYTCDEEVPQRFGATDHGILLVRGRRVPSVI